MTSSCRILHHRFLHDLIPEIPAQILWRAQVHPAAAKERGEFLLHSGYVKECRNPLWIKFNQQINIAIRAKGFTQG